MLKVTCLVPAQIFNDCFPIGVAVVFLDEAFDGGKGVVVHDCLKLAGGSRNLDVLVNFMIATGCFNLGNLFIPA